jgi:arylsulfatase A-like enzyme
MPNISRRDFLKVAGTALAGLATPSPLLTLQGNQNARPNIIILLCDALSASHLSLHGYPRQTTPNMDIFAGKSTVYHNHYSGGNYTTPGTASMLTGMLPWKHRANTLMTNPEFVKINPYTLLGSDYFRFAYSQNPWPDRLIGQYQQDVDRFLPPSAYSLLETDLSSQISNLFRNDRTLASFALNGFMLLSQGESMPTGGAVLGHIHKSQSLGVVNSQHLKNYPQGVPEVSNGGYDLIPYLNEMVFSGVYDDLYEMHSQEQPYFAYFHLYSPHFPFRSHQRYQKLFRNDGLTPAPKPSPSFSQNLSEDYVSSQRALYDRVLAQVDREFGKLIKKLDEDGVLENSYLIVTSDHGELFERGFVGHSSLYMYEPVVRVPLIIHTPGQKDRTDVFALTSNTDILPTILDIAGKEIPPEIDGKILPELGGQPNADRSIFSIYSVGSSAFMPLNQFAIAMRKQNYKLIAYRGYKNVDREYELYDLEADPHEMNDIAGKDIKTLKKMQDEFLESLEQANKPFQRA